MNRAESSRRFVVRRRAKRVIAAGAVFAAAAVAAEPAWAAFMRYARIALAGIVAAAVLALAASTAAANGRATTGRFSYEDRFTVNPGDPSSCSFPVFFDLQVHGSFQTLLDAQGNPIRLIVHEIWSGTGSANGKYVIEHAAQTDLVNLVTGDHANVGSIHDQMPFGGVLIHDVGILRFDGNENLTFEAGQHQGFDGDPAAIAQFCAALT